MTQYLFEHLRSPSNNAADLKIGDDADGRRWGLFAGLFGLANNELYRVTAFDGLSPATHAHCLTAEEWQPTARPTDASPCTRRGLYVFRRFHVREENVTRVVELSAEAWQTFETGADYAAEPMGLFAPAADDNGIVRMMLVTWHDGFASWERSRQPAPAAQQNFKQRHALTLTTYAVATRLL